MDHLPEMDDEDEFDDASSAVAERVGEPPHVLFPSNAPSDVSGVPGDLDADDADDREPMLFKLDWSIEDDSSHRWLDGS